MKIFFYRQLSEKGLLIKPDKVFFVHRLWISAVTFTLFVCIFAAAAPAAARLSDPNVRQQQVERLARQSLQRKAHAWQTAKSQGWKPKGTINGTMFELMAIDAGKPYVYKTCNVNAAISIGADLVRNTAPYDVNGADLTIGIWDGGSVRPTHQEFGSRVAVLDGASAHSHSTHVGGTIGAAGVNASALGMAPSVLIDSYEWTSDLSEMTSRAMSYPNEPGKIQASNHSYSYICGWDMGSWSGTSGPHWWGTYQKKYWNHESDYFGQYDSEVAQWDQLCCDAPYYLPFKAAGNDRGDLYNKAPLDGTQFYYYKVAGPFIQWWSKLYDSSTDPCSDNWDNGGFDTITPIGVAKNIMTVGAVNDAVTGGTRDPNLGTMAGFSAWGPTDDGRIKPDIVTNGVSLYSSTASSDTSYCDPNYWSGTSMAAPGAAGAAMLLVDHYGRLFPGDAMRASTIKALLIHTADDLGSPGPDYKFGWGLVNAKPAAEKITQQYDFPDSNSIVEAALDDVNTVAAFPFEWNGTTPVKATLCWTDPPAAGSTDFDDPDPRLINDLDLRITDPNGMVTFYPFVLNPSNPADTATTDNNTLDNVEQVLIASPTVPGIYTLEVTYKGSLTDSPQYYSLILTGQKFPLLADFSGNGTVDLDDLAIFVTYWLTAEPSVDIVPPGGDGTANFLDFAQLAAEMN